jgi:hypothetical protein
MLTALLSAAIVGSLAPIDAALNSDASISLLQEGRSVGRVSFELVRTGWVWAGITATGTPGEFNLGVPGGGRLTAAMTREGSNLRVVYSARVNQATGVETVHTNFGMPTGWAGGLAQIGTSVFNLPAVQGDFFLGWASGASSTWTAGNGVDRVNFTFPTALGTLVQDSRQWGGGFDGRFGSGAKSPTWAANDTIRYEFVVSAHAPIVPVPSGPFRVQAGPDWIPYTVKLDFVPGSALDWSPPVVTPAGNLGRLIVSPSGKFVFAGAPTRAVRFYGGNLNFSANVPDRPTAEVLARRLRMAGHNAVRLHHYDVEISGGWWRENPVRSTQLDLNAMDRFDYLFHQLKQNGIYVNIDLFTIRQTRQNEIRPGYVDMDDYKALLLVSQAARDNWWAFARNLLLHRNPYTGIKYFNDPTLAWICPVNENNIGSAYQSASAQTRALFDAAWQQAGNSGSFDPFTPAGARFGAELHRQTFQWMRDRIRSIGCRALLTDNNGWHEQTALALNREQLDYVDNHFYWDHPIFLQNAWQLPSRGGNWGGMATFEQGGGIRNMALTRLAGKPFTVSEVNMSAPNRFRAEGGLLVAAMAARQDWDAVWRFAWSHSEQALDGPTALDFFNVQSDPAMLANDRTIVALFRRGDLAPASANVVQRLDRATVGSSGYNAPVIDQPFSNRVSTSFTIGDPNPGPVNGNTGPVTVDRTSGVLRVISPRTVGVYAPPGDAHTVGAATIRVRGTRSAVAVSTLDGQTLTNSKRMLITHVTDVQNTGATFDNVLMQVIRAWGTTPHLVRNGSATVWINANARATLRLWRLDSSGARIAEIPTRVTPSAVIADLSVRGPEGATLYYELAES